MREVPRSKVRMSIEFINEIRDDEELTAMSRIIVAAEQEAKWQGWSSEWDRARLAAYELRQAGFGRVA
jgi:hypothetical protein